MAATPVGLDTVACRPIVLPLAAEEFAAIAIPDVLAAEPNSPTVLPVVALANPRMPMPFLLVACPSTPVVDAVAAVEVPVIAVLSNCPQQNNPAAGFGPTPIEVIIRRA